MGATPAAVLPAAVPPEARPPPLARVFAHGLIVTLGSTPMHVTFTGFSCVMCLFLWRVCFLPVSRVLLLEPPR